jgi:hypothetical protein
MKAQRILKISNVAIIIFSFKKVYISVQKDHVLPLPFLV